MTQPDGGTQHTATGTETDTPANPLAGQRVGTSGGFDDNEGSGNSFGVRLAVLHTDVSHIKSSLDTKLTNLQTDVLNIKNKIGWIIFVTAIAVAAYFKHDNDITSQNTELSSIKGTVNNIKQQNDYIDREIDSLESEIKSYREENNQETKK